MNEPDAAGAPGLDGRSLRTSLLVGLVCLLVYNANLRSISPGDAYPARYLPFAILRDSTLTLDPIEDLVRQGRGSDAYWVVSGRGGHPLSLYPVVLPVLITPLYVPVAVHLRSLGWPEAALERAARIMEKAIASLLAASAAALMFLLLRRRAPARTALLLSLVFAFGTTTWTISSQALWQHGLAELLIVAALLLVTGPATPARVALAGITLGLIAGNRPPDALVAAALGVHALRWSRGHTLLLARTAAVPAGLVLLYNLLLAGHWAGGYGVAGRPEHLGGDVLEGLAGLLVSPTRGLFVFSPFLLFIPFAFRRIWQASEHRLLTAALGIAAALQLLLYSMVDWSGGECWGPRLLTDLLPVFFWMLPPVVAGLSGVLRTLFVVACGAAIAIEAIGAFWYVGASDAVVLASSDPKRARWEVANAPFLVELRHRPPAGDLLGLDYPCDAREVDGGLDRLLAGGREVQDVSASEGFRAEGWALVDGRTPWEVTLELDGKPVGSSSHFRFRHDVMSARDTASASGWSIVVRSDRLSPGEHLLGVYARSCATAIPQLVFERTLVVNDCESVDLDGGLDRLAVGGRDVLEIVVGDEARAEGWTLAGGRTPAEVAVEVGGERVGSTSTFEVREDVVGARGSTSPSGWSIPMRTTGLTPGDHTLTVLVRACETALPDVLQERRVRVSAPEPTPAAATLPASALRAAALLREHQRPEGYWLTSFTSTPSFERPAREMNTFLTALLVDVLGPVAADHALEDSLAAARRHLTAQIEANGLVRYHGLPDAPTIGRLGCAISPDADDTALVWRLAPAERRERLHDALETLRRYRTPEGLYRTWLAPRERYECIDPGRDPNPTDVVIQMHVLQLLAVEDPQGARALCRALAGVIDDDRAWAYYSRAPVLPILRQVDLENEGCALSIPDARLQSTVAGQAVWSAVARLSKRPAGSERSVAHDLLSRLAEDDFSEVRRAPPLLYHNDLSASVPRYYWSEEFGYALWLALYTSQERTRP